MAKKVASDTASYGRTLAQQRQRNAVLIEQAVIDSRSFTEQEAAGAVPPLIEVVASDVGELLQKLDGRTITEVRRARAGACGWRARRAKRSR